MKPVVVHCSDTPNGRPHNAADIHQWHREFGWAGIGYHYVILLDGTIEKGRPDFWEGSHCRGHNEKIGICLIGRDKFTRAQEIALSHLLSDLGFSDRSATVDKLYSHYDLDCRKTCPNFDVVAWWSTGVYQWPLLED